MAVATVSIGTGLYNLLWYSYNVRDVKNFGKALSALTVSLSKNYFQDSATVFTYGLLPINTLFALLGISHMQAVQNLLGLLAIGNLPSATGFVFAKRGDYLYYLGNDLLEIIDPNNASVRASVGLDLTSLNRALPVDKLAILGSLLRDLRARSPSQFSSIAVSEPITQFLDNLATFDRIRNGYQATVPAVVAPSPIIGVSTVVTRGAIASPKSSGFGTSY